MHEFHVLIDLEEWPTTSLSIKVGHSVDYDVTQNHRPGSQKRETIHQIHFQIEQHWQNMLPMKTQRMYSVVYEHFTRICF